MILDIAREVSDLLRSAKLDGAVIGGVSVVLHGHVRTTADVDVFVGKTPEAFATELKKHGYVFHRGRKEFSKDGIAVQLVTEVELRTRPARCVEIDGIRTVSLPDLIGMKLRSGTRNVLRAQDLADVIGLIRARRLTIQFAGRLDKSLRAEFRSLVKAIQKQCC